MSFLSGVCVCATGISSKEEKIIKSILKNLGGSYASNFNQSVTHLIVKRVGSKKHESAIQQNVYTVEINWLVDCSTNVRRMNEDAYKVLPFTGLLISVTQLEPDDRHAVKRLVQSNGGIFMPNMEREKTTHLVALRPEGDKYTAAVQWKAHVVPPSWVNDCVERKRWLSESSFPLPALLPDRASPEKPQLQKDEMSRSETQPSMKSPRPQPSIKLRPDSIGASRDASAMSAPVDLDLHDLLEALRPWSPSPPPPTVVPRDLPIIPNSLIGETIFISGFSETVTLLLIQMICLSGGFRSPILTDGVSAILLGQRASEKLLDTVSILATSIPAVKVSWLIRRILPSTHPSPDPTSQPCLVQSECEDDAEKEKGHSHESPSLLTTEHESTLSAPSPLPKHLSSPFVLSERHPNITMPIFPPPSVPPKGSISGHKRSRWEGRRHEPLPSLSLSLSLPPETQLTDSGEASSQAMADHSRRGRGNKRGGLSTQDYRAALESQIVVYDGDTAGTLGEW